LKDVRCGVSAGYNRRGAKSSDNGLGADLSVNSTGDVLRAMVRDPHCVFLYWRLTSRAGEKPKERHGPWAIRVRNLTSGHVHVVPVAPEGGNYYMRVRPACNYIFELGIGGREEFQVVCRSRPVAVPGESPYPIASVNSGAAAARSGAARPRQDGRSAPAGPVGLTYRGTRMYGASSFSSHLPFRKKK